MTCSKHVIAQSDSVICTDVTQDEIISVILPIFPLLTSTWQKWLRREQTKVNEIFAVLLCLRPRLWHATFHTYMRGFCVSPGKDSGLKNNCWHVTMQHVFCLHSAINLWKLRKDAAAMKEVNEWTSCDTWPRGMSTWLDSKDICLSARKQQTKGQTNVHLKC